ncbi:MAG: response regulator, partial [Erysipelotrichaceae bacterium]|nr:response regulator [Erysipelotrichaceae bacterium]
MKNGNGNSDSNNIFKSDSSEVPVDKISYFSRQIWKKAIKYLIPLVIVAVVAGSLICNYQKTQSLEDLQKEQKFFVDFEAELLDDDVDNVIAELSYLLTLDREDNLWDNAHDINTEAMQSIKVSIIAKMNISQLYKKAVIIDIEGNEVLRLEQQAEGVLVVPDSELQNKKDRYYFNNMLRLEPGQIYVTRMELQVENGGVVQPESPIIRFVKVLRDSRGETRGMLILYYDANTIIEKIKMAEKEPNKLMLLNLQGYWMFGTETKKEWGFAYPEREMETFEKYYPEVWREILNKDQGCLVTSEGSFVFRKINILDKIDINHVTDDGAYPWIIVSFVPNDILSAANLNSILTISSSAIVILILITLIIIINIRSRYKISAKNKTLENYNSQIEKLYSELRKKEERLSLAIEGAGDGVWDWWILTGEMKFSKLYVEMLGYEENELPFHVNTWIDSVHPEDYPWVEKKLKDYFEGHVSEYSIELRLRCKDNRYKWILCRGAVVERDNDRNPVRMIGVHTDITKRKELEEEIVLSRGNEKKANDAKSEFLSNMSHEIRTPLNAIVGFTDLTLKTSLTPQQSNYLNKIKASSGILLGIIGDILDISKLEADKVELEIHPFEIEEMLRNVTAQISNLCQEKELELLVSIAEDVPVSLMGDSLRLGQVLINLTSNAVKFTDEGAVCIEVKLLQNGGSSALLRFSVSDTGIGLTEEQIENLFQPFNQAETSTTRKFGGTGLGLAISKKMVSLMGGEIWVESEKGKGSTFFVTVRFDIAGEKRFSEFKNAFKMWNMKVLVVDDSRECREVIKSMLTSMSFDVTTCSSGEEAVTIIQKAADTIQYDLMITDWNMPGMDGIEASRQIKRLRAPDDSPAIIMLTAYNSPQIQAEVNQLGLAALLFKPVTPSLLLNTIMQIYGKEEFEQTYTGLDGGSEPDDLELLRGIRVLLVEDNEINQEVAQEILQGAGMTVVIANNGKVATEMVNSGTYDIILMDVQMPVMNGYDATKAIRNNPAFSELPIIAMTAIALKGEKEKCIQAGMNDYITKPIDTTLLFQTMGRWLAVTQKSKPDKEPFGEFEQPPAKSKTLTTEDGAMPKLDGIDVQSALSRLGGNQKLYRKLLVKFHKNHQNDIKTIRQILDMGDFETAERMIHTIKGAAGNIGAQEVYNASVAFEAMTEDLTLEYMEPLLGQLEKSLELVFASIAFLEDKHEKTTHSEHDGVSVAQLIP